jgi:hypothetical protein
MTHHPVHDFPRFTLREKFSAHFLLQFAGSAFILRHEFGFVGEDAELRIQTPTKVTKRRWHRVSPTPLDSAKALVL